MPAYNEIYKKLASDGFDPYLTAERHDAGNNRNASESVSGSKSTAEASSLARTTTSNTPASFMDDPTDPKYMSGLTQSTSESDSTTEGSESSSGKSAGDYIIESSGRSGYLGDAVLSSLATGFLNTDLMVCEMLEPLFMQFWDDQPL